MPSPSVVIGIVGFKNSGKTTLMVALIAALASRGLRVATVKHAHHEFDIDHQGKDSWRHRDAGAREVIVASSRRWAQIRETGVDSEPALPELLARLGPADIVLVEGYKYGGHPKIEVRRAGAEVPLLAASDDSVFAIVSDEKPDGCSAPVYAPGDIDTIVAAVLELMARP